MKKYLLFLIVCAFVIAWWKGFFDKSTYYAKPNENIVFKNLYIAARDVEKLSSFYQKVFDMEVFNDASIWSFPNRKESGVLLKTPGYQGDGPSFKILQGSLLKNSGPLEAFDLGYAHICFEADDVVGVVKKIVENGGMVLSEFEDNDRSVAIYTADPEGNVIEIHFPFASPLTLRNIYRSINSLVRIHFKLEPPETNSVRLIHVNINSLDWQMTSAFYQKTTGAIPVGIKRSYEGSFISKLTGVKNAVINGQHIALAGYSEGGPTFELFTYNNQAEAGPLTLESIGYIAVGFEVKNLDQAMSVFLAAGGERVSEIFAGSVILKDRDENYIHLKQTNGAGQE